MCLDVYSLPLQVDLEDFPQNLLFTRPSMSEPRVLESVSDSSGIDVTDLDGSVSSHPDIEMPPTGRKRKKIPNKTGKTYGHFKLKDIKRCIVPVEGYEYSNRDFLRAMGIVTVRTSAFS